MSENIQDIRQVNLNIKPSSLPCMTEHTPRANEGLVQHIRTRMDAAMACNFTLTVMSDDNRHIIVTNRIDRNPASYILSPSCNDILSDFYHNSIVYIL